MKIECHRLGTVEVLTPNGALVDEDAELFSKEVLDKLKASNPRLVVSLHEVPYMDSVALEGIADAIDELSDRAVRLKLVQVTPTCREVLELTGLASRVQFFEEVQDAVKSFL